MSTNIKPFLDGLKKNYAYTKMEVFPVAQTVENQGLIPGSGRSSGQGNGNPLQYSYLETLMDGEVWQATVHGVTKSQTRLSHFTFTFFLSFHYLYIHINQPYYF